MRMCTCVFLRVYERVLCVVCRMFCAVCVEEGHRMWPEHRLEIAEARGMRPSIAPSLPSAEHGHEEATFDVAAVRARCEKKSPTHCTAPPSPLSLSLSLSILLSQHPMPAPMPFVPVLGIPLPPSHQAKKKQPRTQIVRRPNA